MGDDDDDDDEEEEEEEELTEADKQFIVADDEGEELEAKKRRKRKRRIEEDEDLDEEDLELLQENYGISSEKKWKKLRKKADEPVTKVKRKSLTGNDLTALFEDEDEEDQDILQETPQKQDDQVSSTPKKIRSVQEFFDEDEDDLDDFIINDEEEGDEHIETQAERMARRKEKKKMVKNMGMNYGISDDTWRDIQDIFGDGSDYAYALKSSGNNAEMDDFDEPEEKQEIKLTDLYEPAEIAEKLLTEEDEIIRIKDVPERFQLLGDLPAYDEMTLDAQASYITRIIRAERKKVNNNDRTRSEVLFDVVKKVLKFLQKDHFEIPFIYAHRKDYFNEALDRTDLWRVYDLARQWFAMTHAKQRVTKTIQELMSADIEDVALTMDEQVYLEEHLRSAESMEDVTDVSELLQIKYGEHIQQLEDVRQQTSEKIFKRPQRKKTHEQARKKGMGGLAKQFGINVRGFVDALINRQIDSHNPEDPLLPPLIAAQGFVCSEFPTPEIVLDAARQMIAQEIAADPRLKMFVRNVYLSDAVVTVTPTARGVTEIDVHHPYYYFKYLKEKPVFMFTDGQFLQILAAESEGLVTVSAKIDAEDNFRDDVMKCIANDYFNENARVWNEERRKVAEYALTDVLFPCLTRWLKEKLSNFAADYVLGQCVQTLLEDANMAPFQREYRSRHDDAQGANVMGLSWGEGDRNSSTFGAALNEFGELMDHIRLDRMQDMNAEAKNADLDNLALFVKRHKIDLIVISGWAPNTKTRLFEDVATLMRDRFNGSVEVQMMDDQVARIYMDSSRAIKEFPEKLVGSNMVRYCISLARKAQDPVMELAGLFNMDDEIKLLNLHSLQKWVPDDKLKKGLERAFLNTVNTCGVDVNLAVMYTHKAHTLQFVSGLGPRKAQAMMAKISRLGGKLESRASLIKEHLCATQVFMNCASFIRIRRYHFYNSRHGDEMWDVLDDTRIHPEDYDLARKMAADAIEVEEPLDSDDNPSLHVQDLMDGDIERLELLLLDDYAIELEKSLHEPKRITLNEIKSELKDPYKDRRVRFQPPSLDRIFTMLTHETDDTLYPNMMVACRIIRLMDRLIKVSLNSGLDGMIHIKNLDLDPSMTPAQGGYFVDQVLKCRVLVVNKERFSVELSCRQDDLFDRGTDSVKRDKFFSLQLEEKEMMEREAEIRKARAKTMISINHPDFQNVDYRQAEVVLQDRPVGDYVIRPSTKGPRHLSITWKVANSVYQHVDVQVDDSTGRGYAVGNQRFSELDELLILYIEPMVRNVKEIMNTAPKYQNRDLRSMMQYISQQSEAQRKSTYGFILVPEKPGRFYFVYHHVGASRAKYEYIGVKPEGFVFREKVFSRIEDVIAGFKHMEKKKAMEKDTGSSKRHATRPPASSYRPPVDPRRR